MKITAGRLSHPAYLRQEKYNLCRGWEYERLGNPRFSDVASLLPSDTGNSRFPTPFRSNPQNENNPLLKRIILIVPRVGFEPTCLAALAPKASASANFATSAACISLV